MSQDKELQEIAESVAEITIELMEDSIDWQLSDYPANGDEYNAIHAEVMFHAIEKMYMSARKHYYEIDDSCDGLAASMTQD